MQLHVFVLYCVCSSSLLLTESQSLVCTGLMSTVYTDCEYGFQGASWRTRRGVYPGQGNKGKRQCDQSMADCSSFTVQT